MIDVLFLLCNAMTAPMLYYQLNTGYMFSQHLSVTLNRKASDLMFAIVKDGFTDDNPNVNVSSWQFHPKYGSVIDGDKFSRFQSRQEYNSTQEMIDRKVQFVQRLFSEMGGVRKNASHVGVIFLNGFSFSEDERRKVPQFVEQVESGIKVYVFIIGGMQSQQMKDTFDFASNTVDFFYTHTIIMNICGQCLTGWFPLEHSEGTDSLSCYFLVDNKDYHFDWLGISICLLYGSFPAAIESREEQRFLTSTIQTKLKRKRIKYTTDAYIGLYRDLLDGNERLHWSLTYPIRVRPLVINNWLAGKPSGGRGYECVVWQFVFSSHENNATNISSNESHFVDGWTDVECESKTRFTLCEVVLPRRLEDTNFMRIEPASDESFNQILTKGDFIKFGENIVSISTHIVNKTFIKLLGAAKFELFPLFDCGDDAGEYRYISYMLVCDSLNDCSNKRDESYCLAKKKRVLLERKDIDCKESCKGIYCCSGACLPLINDKDGQVDCNVCINIDNSDGIEEDAVLDEYLKRNTRSAFICYRGKCVFSSELTSDMSGCDRLDRQLDKVRRNTTTDLTCRNVLGNSFWAPSCVYVKDGHGTVFDCRRMSHLEGCKDFVCPEGYVKCPNTYCIAQHYVLDGQEDCPKGEDEQINNIGPCTGNFACWDSKVCLHPDLVCDGHPDCPHRDDEIDCYVECAEGFRCVSGTVTISNYTSAFEHLVNQTNYKTRYMGYYGLDLKLKSFSFAADLATVMFINWSHCQITDLYHTLGNRFNGAHLLDVSYNGIPEFDSAQIDTYTSYNFRHLNFSHNRDLTMVDTLHFPLLETLDLSYTGLTKLEQLALRGSQNLKNLNLSFTLISSFDANYKFPTNFNPQTLNVRGLPIENLYEDFFKGLSVSQHLYTDRFELCCPQIRGPNIPAHVCHAPDDAISSCFDLIAVNVQRVLLWVVAVLAVLGNTTVIVYRVIWDRSSLRTGYGLFVTNLGISDCIMGVYLFIIAGADYYYRNIYVLYDKTWRESIVCRLAGFLATLSSETSTFFVFLITLDRFLIIKFPFGQVKLSEISKIIALLVSWVVSFILALTPIMLKFEINSSNAMCLGLPLTTKQLLGWEFSFGMFIVLNFVISLVIACGQRAIFGAMSAYRYTGAASNTSSRRAVNIIVAKQLSLVALSNFLCWFPIGFMGLLTLMGREISNDVFAWTTVIVLPINSAANPLLYTIPVLLDKWEKFKFRERPFQKTAT